MSKTEKLTAAQLKNLRAGYASAMKAYLDAKHQNLDARIEVSRLQLIDDAVKEVKALQIPDGANAEQLRQEMLGSCYKVTNEFFTDRGYREEKVTLFHPQMLQQEQDRRTQAKRIEQAQLKLAIKESVIEALRELGFGADQEN